MSVDIWTPKDSFAHFTIDMGDGSSTKKPSSTHFYPKYGTYKVAATAYNNVSKVCEYLCIIWEENNLSDKFWWTKPVGAE